MSELPGVLAEVEEVAGREAAVKLALGFGGRDIHIPRPDHVKAGHPLVACLGAPAAVKVAGRFMGESVYIPKARRALVHHLAAAGETNARIAETLGLSRSSVRSYLRH